MDEILKRGTRLNRDSLNDALHDTNTRINGEGVSRVARRILIEGEAGVSVGRFNIPIVAQRPVPRDTNKVYIIYWAHSSEIPGATGDGQLWCWSHRHKSWYPLMFPSDLSWENIIDPEMEGA
ncbi:MAG: hypothetical protein ABIK73_07050 [candidate division WOR-3 bacterium]